MPSDRKSPGKPLCAGLCRAPAQLGSFSAFLLAALLSGVLQFGLGMLAAIGLLLIAKQIPFAFGIGGPAAQSFASWPGMPAAWADTAIACVSLALLVAWDTPALKLAKPALFRSVLKQGPAAFVPFAATIAGVLAVDLLFGIALGLACSVLAVAVANPKNPVTLAQHDDHFLLSFRRDASLLGKAQVRHRLRHIPDRAAMIIDATRADYIDHDVLELLDAFIADAARRGIAVEFRRRSPAPRPAARRGSFRAPAAE